MRWTVWGEGTALDEVVREVFSEELIVELRPE